MSKEWVRKITFTTIIAKSPLDKNRHQVKAWRGTGYLHGPKAPALLSFISYKEQIANFPVEKPGSPPRIGEWTKLTPPGMGLTDTKTSWCDTPRTQHPYVVFWRGNVREAQMEGLSTIGWNSSKVSRSQPTKKSQGTFPDERRLRRRANGSFGGKFL